MANPTVTFYGAVGTVTGSRFLLTGNQSSVLIDCGMFQGLKELRLRNWEPFPCDVTQIDAVVLTHAHLDHCGYLPRLVKQGFTGTVYVTQHTAALASIILRDSATLQVEDARYAKKKGFSKHKEPLPLYNLEEAEAAIKLFRPIAFHEEREISPGIKLTFHRSGHILGSAHAEIDVDGKHILFSGDLGRPGHPLLSPPDSIDGKVVDAIVVESTYGDRTHPPVDKTLAEAINRTISRGGSVLIPAFAIDRTEILLMRLKRLLESKAIPHLPIYVDSPMALSALREYRKAIAQHSPEIRPEFYDQPDPFECGQMNEITSIADSKSINEPAQPSIIISASGMATGGRVVHHLEFLAPNPRNSVILVGYQAAGTRGQKLLSGVKELKMYGKFVPVRAEVIQIEEFSVHADAKELAQWLSGATPKQVFVVHGEAVSAHEFAHRLHRDLGWQTVIPEEKREYPI